MSCSGSAAIRHDGHADSVRTAESRDCGKICVRIRDLIDIAASIVYDSESRDSVRMRCPKGEEIGRAHV